MHFIMQLIKEFAMHREFAMFIISNSYDRKLIISKNIEHKKGRVRVQVIMRIIYYIITNYLTVKKFK